MRTAAGAGTIPRNWNIQARNSTKLQAGNAKRGRTVRVNRSSNTGASQAAIATAMRPLANRSRPELRASSAIASRREAPRSAETRCCTPSVACILFPLRHYRPQNAVDEVLNQLRVRRPRKLGPRNQKRGEPVDRRPDRLRGDLDIAGPKEPALNAGLHGLAQNVVCLMWAIWLVRGTPGSSNAQR